MEYDGELYSFGGAGIWERRGNGEWGLKFEFSKLEKRRKVKDRKEIGSEY
jgi:hypothetical protein